MKFSWSDNGNLKQITFDATPGETHLISATITEHPVEKGVALTDHVRQNPFKITVEVVISNTPIDLPSAADDSFTDGAKRQSTQVNLSLQQTQQITQLASGSSPSKTSSLSPSAQATAYQFSSQFDRVRKIYEALQGLVDNATAITIQTSLCLYDSMEIVSISVPRSSEMGANAMRFTIDCQEIRTVESQQVATPAPLAQPQKRGHKPTKEETDKKRATALHNVVDSISGFFKAHS